MVRASGALSAGGISQLRAIAANAGGAGRRGPGRVGRGRGGRGPLYTAKLRANCSSTLPATSAR